MVKVFVRIHVKAIAVRVVWRIEVYERRFRITTWRQIIAQEVQGIHVAHVYLLFTPCDRKHPVRQSLPVETGVHFPFPRLVVSPNRSGAKNYTGPIATIQKEKLRSQAQMACLSLRIYRFVVASSIPSMVIGTDNMYSAKRSDSSNIARQNETIRGSKSFK